MEEKEIFRKIDTIDREILKRKKRLESLRKIKPANVSEIQLLEPTNPGISKRAKSCNDEIVNAKNIIIDEINASINSLDEERKTIVKDSFPFLKDTITIVSFYVFVISPEGLKKILFGPSLSRMSIEEMPGFSESNLLPFRMLGSATIKKVKPEYWNFITSVSSEHNSFEERISGDYSVDVWCHDFGFSYVEYDLYGILHVVECEDASIADKHVGFLNFDYYTFASNRKVIKDLFLKVLESSAIKIYKGVRSRCAIETMKTYDNEDYEMISDGVYFVKKRQTDNRIPEVLWRAERHHGCKTRI